EPGSPDHHGWDKPLGERIRKLEFWRDLLIYFVVFSLLGHWAEILFCQLIRAGVFMGGYDPSNAMLWDQWLFPFTAEGAALVAIVFILQPAAQWLLKKTGNRIVPALLLSFLLNMLICTGIDFTTGMIANQDYQLWDYRDMPFNFMGQVCLQNSLVYSIAATLIVWVVYPFMDSVLHRAPRGVTNAIAAGLIGMYLFLAMLYFVDITALRQ
ncbi:MAG: putative ABC transporter permease, partial [Eggerthellaceae bacterium]|nr:putative ABC transporter permease [Eggerthellaceae bacterium]